MRSNGTQSAADGLPSPEVRGIVGLFLFIHLFSVAVALSSYADTSALENRLQQVLGPYSSTLNFDLRPNVYPSGRFYLTHAEVSDVDFSVEIEGTLPDGTVEKTSLPTPGLWPGQWRRYQALANAAGAMATSEDVEPVLLRSLAGSILKRWAPTGAWSGSKTTNCWACWKPAAPMRVLEIRSTSAITTPSTKRTF